MDLKSNLIHNQLQQPKHAKTNTITIIKQLPISQTLNYIIYNAQKKEIKTIDKAI